MSEIIKGDIGFLEKLNNNVVRVNREYDTQGRYYKNYSVFNKQKNMTLEEFNTLPLEEKIAYVPENGIHTFRDDPELIKKYKQYESDYSSYFSIKEEVEHYIENTYNREFLNKISKKDLDNMIEDVFKTVDWQHTSSLIYEDYLEGYLDDLFAKHR